MLFIFFVGHARKLIMYFSSSIMIHDEYPLSVEEGEEIVDFLKFCVLPRDLKEVKNNWKHRMTPLT